LLVHVEISRLFHLIWDGCVNHLSKVLKDFLELGVHV
jgi:hypothetical protein